MKSIPDDLLWSLLTQAGRDPQYQKCMQAVRELEPGFQALRGELTEVQRQTLDEYLAAWEALDDALALVAYRRGRTDSMK